MEIWMVFIAVYYGGIALLIIALVRGVSAYLKRRAGKEVKRASKWKRILMAWVIGVVFWIFSAVSLFATSLQGAITPSAHYLYMTTVWYVPVTLIPIIAIVYTIYVLAKKD